jgi:hypothetical protein
MRRFPLALLSACLLLLLPAAASATTRYADTAGDGAAPCAAADPCSIENAYSAAVPGEDEVLVLAGSYTIEPTLVLDKDVAVRGQDVGAVTLHGLATQANPDLVAITAGSIGNVLVRLDLPPSSDCPMAYTALNAEGPAAVVDGVVVDYTNSQPCSGAAAWVGHGATMRNSFVTVGSNAAGIRTGADAATPTLRNVTVIGAGNSTALVQNAGPLHVSNSILRGGPDGLDVRSVSFSDDHVLTLHHSNFDPARVENTNIGDPATDDLHDNQSVAPLLQAGGHQQSGSPTIDAGDATGIGFDERALYDDARLIGTNPDIGATERDQSLPPRVSTPTVVAGPRAADVQIAFDVFANDATTTVDVEASETADFATVAASDQLSVNYSGGHLEPVIDGLDPATTYYVRVRAESVNGSADPKALAAPVQTLAAPAATISGPAATADATPTFTVTPSRAGVTLECRVVPALYEPCNGAWTSGAPLTDGAHVVEVRAGDGSMTASPVAHDVRVDATAPQTSIATAPQGETTSTAATIAFAADEAGATFACSLDGAAFASCTSPTALAGLAVGEHTFRVRATDAFGHVDATPAAATWKVVAPAVDPPAGGQQVVDVCPCCLRAPA